MREESAGGATDAGCHGEAEQGDHAPADAGVAGFQRNDDAAEQLQLDRIG